MKVVVALLTLVLLGCAGQSPQYSASAITQMSVPQLQLAIKNAEITAVQVTQAFLNRIEALDDNGPALHAIIEVNPDALAIAAELDQKKGKMAWAGPLHGIPVVLKANIDTRDRMATSAGSIALADHRAEQDAFLVQRLRDSGAVILAKANLSEWANFRSENSSSGWSSLGGQTTNPYAAGHNPCGSSSGSAVAVAAQLSPLAVGTETNGSIVCPAGINGIVGVKPTVGLISRSGIIPISHTQDTAGPMANSVVGAALLLDAMVGKDPKDTSSVSVYKGTSFVPDLNKLDLKGVRVGVLRSYYGAALENVRDVLQHNISSLQELGAIIVDPVATNIPSSVNDAAYEVLLFEFKNGLNQYLAQHKIDPSVNTLAKLIQYNEANAGAAMPIFGQEIFIKAEAKGDLTSADYQLALQNSHYRMRAIMDKVLEENKLDVIIAPANAPSWKTDWENGDHFTLSSSSLAARSGYASVVVPAGFIDGLPVGIAFIGGAFSEKQLLQYAYAFEQKTKARQNPDLDAF
ncbi:MAG: amidase [Pseudomonadota bacterium]